MSGQRKQQKSLLSFLGQASAGSGDGGSAQRTVGSIARREMQEAVKDLARQYFDGLFQVIQRRGPGQPSRESKERERAARVLSEAFSEGYFATNETVSRDVAEGKDNRALLTEKVAEWWLEDQKKGVRRWR